MFLFVCFCFYNSFIKYMFLCGSGWFFMSTEEKSWSDSRQYCRDHGADLIIINTEEKQVSLCECLLMNDRNHTYSCFYSLRDSYLHSPRRECGLVCLTQSRRAS